MAYSSIKIKTCKCGCGKPPTISCRGWNISCLPKLEKIEKIGKYRKSQNERAKRAVSRKRLHEVQFMVGMPKWALKPPKKRTPISKVSKKRLAELKIYSVLRKDYLKDNPICEVDGCKNKSIEIHHKKGRGVLLNVVKYWMFFCQNHNNWIGDNQKQERDL